MIFHVAIFHVCSVLFRILISVSSPSLISLISYRTEVSTPVTSYKRMLEGIYLYKNKIDPYDGGVFHQAPLLLLIYSIVPRFLHLIIPIILDCFISYFLYWIAVYRKPILDNEEWVVGEVIIEDENQDEIDSKEEIKTASDGLRKRKNNKIESASIVETVVEDETIPPKDSIDPELVSLLYLINPLSILSCLGGTTNIWSFFLLIGALYFACQGLYLFNVGKRSSSMCFLATAVYLGVYPIVALVPCLLILSSKSPNIILSLTEFFGFLAALLLSSGYMMGSWNFLESTYGVM